MTQIKKGAVVSYVAVAFNIVAGFLFTPFLIRKVGVGPYGVYILVSTFLNYFLIDFGLGNAVAKYLSEYRAQNDIESANRFISVAFKLFAMIAVGIGILLFALFFFLDSFFIGLTSNEIILFKQMYVISGCSSVVLFIFIPLNGMLISHELFFAQKLIELLHKVFFILLSCFVLFFNTNVISIVLINVLTGFLVVGLKIIIIKKRTNFHIIWQLYDFSIIKKVGAYSFWLTAIMIAQRFIIPIAPTILGRFSNSTEISIFSIATTVEGYVFTLAACLNGLFLPKLTVLYLKNKHDLINFYFNKVGRIQTYVIGLIISTFIVFGKEFIILWVGEKFIKAYYVLLLILPSTIVVYAQEVANSMMLIQEKHKYKAFCYLFGAALSVVITCLLSPNMGAVGAGIGICLCLWICQVIVMNFVYSKLLFLDIKGFFVNCYGKVIPCLFAITYLGLMVNKQMSNGSVSFFVLKSILYISFVCALYYFIAFNEDEKLMLKNFFQKK